MVIPNSVCLNSSILLAPCKLTLTRAACPPVPGMTLDTLPLKPYHGDEASTMTHSPILSGSFALRAPGRASDSLFFFSLATASKSFSSLRSSMESPTTLKHDCSPLLALFSSWTILFSLATCTWRRALVSISNCSCMRSCLMTRPRSTVERCSCLAAHSSDCVLAFSSTSLAFTSRSSARRTFSTSSLSRSSALRWSARSERWSSPSSDSARSTSACGSLRRRAVSMACDSPMAFRTSRNVGLPSLYSMAETSVRASSIPQFFNARLCVVATRRVP
mmetsp:Transcript_95205/g.272921  ORF Transcript_95205/g.272921 Transcript_95205/m.272921 type:complete len:276 (-) Transcript_95205:1409-2236(-)